MTGLFTQGTTACDIFILAMVVASGLYLGKFKVKGVSLGTTWILFVGILLSHFGLTIAPPVLAFIKDFGLILFVFAIGLQVGPGFFHSFRKDGLPANLLAVAMVGLAVAVTLVIHTFTGERLDVLTGVMSAAVTNTPGLGAAQQTLVDATIAAGGTAEEAAQASSGIAAAYAVAYPLGVLGAIFLVIALKWVFRVNGERESRPEPDETDNRTCAYRLACTVENPAIVGKTLHNVMGEHNNEHLVVSRIMRDGKVSQPDLDMPLREGDKLLIVTDMNHKDLVRVLFGSECSADIADWQQPGSELMSRRLSITSPAITGKSLRKLDIRHRFGVTVTRIMRSSIDLQADADLILQVGDCIQVVGTEEGIGQLADLVGNRPESLHKPNLVPIFFGITLGVVAGMIPIPCPWTPQPLKLGLAGGPLIVAILLGHFGPKLRITTYTALSANLMIREIGISLFMAAVGIGAGRNFVSSLAAGGYMWILYGLAITLVPMAVVAVVARYSLKMNFFKICGLLAGSTTDPALLTFAEQMYGNPRIAINYATVYPLTMFLRVVAAQMLIMIML